MELTESCIPNWFFVRVEESRRVPVNRRPLLALFAAFLLPFLASGCGGDTRRLLGISASSTPLTSTGYTLAQSRNLVGVGGTEPIFIMANYSGGNSAVDVTSEAEYVSSNPNVVTVGKDGIIELITGACDWIQGVKNPNPPPAIFPPAIDLTQQITITATWKNQTTAILVNVNSLEGCAGPPEQS
jgi:hypothetical protein